jgi:hypothetical protein
MYPRTTFVQLRLAPDDAEVLYYELLGLLAYYQQDVPHTLEPQAETALRWAANQLEAGLARAQAVGDFQLQQLRAVTSKPAGER